MSRPVLFLWFVAARWPLQLSSRMFLMIDGLFNNVPHTTFSCFARPSSSIPLPSPLSTTLQKIAFITVSHFVLITRELVVAWHNSSVCCLIEGRSFERRASSLHYRIKTITGFSHFLQIATCKTYWTTGLFPKNLGILRYLTPCSATLDHLCPFRCASRLGQRRLLLLNASLSDLHKRFPH